MDKLIQVLEASVKKYGGKEPLTLGHLLNIAKLAAKLESNEAEILDQADQDAQNSLRDEYGT